MKEKLLFISPSLCGGGAEKTIANLSLVLSKKYDVSIVVFNDTDIKYAYSGRLISLGKSKTKSKLEKIFFAIKAIFKVRRIKKKQKIDYSISFLATADLVNVLSTVKNTKNIISIRNTDSLNHEGSINYYFTKFSCKKADHIVSISEQVKKDIIKKFRINHNKITTIYNPAMRTDFGKSEMMFDDDFFKNPVFLNIGRLTKQKGQWHLIKAFSLVVQHYKNAKLLILGEGELKSELGSLIKHYKLENNVFLLGFVKNPYDYLMKSKCFIFSSLYEGLGNSILEAMTCSTPIISTDCVSGPREILAPDTDWENKTTTRVDYAKYGILVPGFNSTLDIDNRSILPAEKKMAEAMQKIISNEELCNNYRKQSKRRSRDFDVEKIAMEWEDVMKNTNKQNKAK